MMSALRLLTGPHIAGRQIQGVLAKAGPPRVLVRGPAGSGKSAVLNALRDALAEEGLAVHSVEADIDIATLPPEDVLVVDDLHLLSAERIVEILSRAQDPVAGLVVSLRPWPRTPSLREIERRLQQGAPPIILGQVSVAQVLGYLKSVGKTAPRRCVEELLEVTGGAAWLVTYALAMDHDEHCRGGADHHDHRRELEHQVIQRLDTLDLPLRRLIEHASLGAEGEGATEEDGVAGDDLVLQGYSEGLLLRNGIPLPAVRAAVRSSVSHHWKAANGAALAEGIARTPLDRDPSLDDLIDGVKDQRVGEALVTRADQLFAQDPQRAVELYDAALTAGADPSAMALRQARAAWAAGQFDAAAQFVDNALADELCRGHAELLDTAAAVWAARDMMAMASEVYGTSTGQGGSASATRARIARLGSGQAEASEDRASETRGESVPSTHGIAMRLLDHGLQLSLASDPSGEALSDLLRASELYTAAGATQPIPELPAVIAASVAVGAGDLTSARQVLDAAIEGGQGGPWARRRLLLWQGLVAIQAERPADARRALAEAEVDRHPLAARDARLMHTVHITLVRRYEDLPALEAAWVSSRSGVAHPDVDLYTLFPLATLLGAAARVGDSTTLAPHLRIGLGLLQRLGSPPLWSTHLWWAGIQQGILLNRPDSLTPYAQALVKMADRSPLAATMANAGSVWVSVLAGKVDGGAVEDAARSLGAAGLAWDGGRLAAHGARRTSDRRVATRLLACARDLHPRESTATAPAEEDTLTAGASETVAQAQLSDREFEVARLVLRGKTYVEIGESLFISPRTVEHHVAHMRRRLSATSRSDLISRLRLVVDSFDDPAAANATPVNESPHTRARV